MMKPNKETLREILGWTHAFKYTEGKTINRF
jgi:hypothetical protein